MRFVLACLCKKVKFSVKNIIKKREAVLLISYKVAYRIPSYKEPHSIPEELIAPDAVKMIFYLSFTSSHTYTKGKASWKNLTKKGS